MPRGTGQEAGTGRRPGGDSRFAPLARQGRVSLVSLTLKIRAWLIYLPSLAILVEPLQRLTRRQVEALQVILLRETPEGGVSLNAIAKSLKISPPSALGHVTLLENLGLVSRHRGKTRLTLRGQSTLAEYRRHHRVAETLFGSLGLTPAETCAAAREIDLAISHRTVEEVCRAQQHPAACPHGEPIAPCHASNQGG